MKIPWYVTTEAVWMRWAATIREEQQLEAELQWMQVWEALGTNAFKLEVAWGVYFLPKVVKQ